MQNGFSLIELIIVVTILAIVSVIVLLAIGNPQPRARDSTRLADIDYTQNHIERYMTENDEYPDFDNFEDLVADFSTRYVQRFTDISDPGYFYELRSDGYCLCAELEEPQKANSGPECEFDFTGEKFQYCLRSFQ